VFAVAYLGYTTFSLPLNTVAHFVVAALFLINPISFLTQGAQQLAPGMASLRHLERIGLDIELEIEDATAGRARPAELPSMWQRLRAADVRFRYPAEAEQGYELGPIDLDIYRGEMVFLTGGNGSGKSTLLLLLCGLLRPSAGRLLIDGHAVSDDMIRYRARFAGVFGDCFLFPHVLDGTGQCLPDSRIKEHLQWLGLGNKVHSNQGELSTLALSTGQRKRIALLQCYAEDREICFFDEWAADQDTQFREYFYCVLLPRLKQMGKTLLVISHDDRYFHVADRIIKLEGGRIIDDSLGHVAQMTSTSSAH
jgi:putative ATP-binding cassette transporter